MKVIKTLKFWSKKKNKKRITTIHHHSPPSCCCNLHHHDRTFQPSAPPLPSWLDYEKQTYNQHLLASEITFPGLPVSYDPQEHEQVVNPSSASGDVETGRSYQQYMAENPVYVLPSRETERSSGAVGCVINIGAHLVRCFFPCFWLRDAQKSYTF